MAGVGGASLGTEIVKCLTLANRYLVFGCDISGYAYGHYMDGCESTFVADRDRYVESIIEICRQARIDCIVPGGEEPTVLLGRARAELAASGIQLAANSAGVVADFSDKGTTFEILGRLGFATPLTTRVGQFADLDAMSFPCVVKPAVGSGGSSFVFLAENKDEAWLCASYSIANGKQVIVQEYLPLDEGEFTVGVLSQPDGAVVGSIALRKLFDSKLSVLIKGKFGLISSGYSQGLIDDFPAVRALAERMAVAIGSTGPINIQGRIKDGVFVPFEINPRFSASTYLRAKAGFNELDLYLQYILHGIAPVVGPLRAGYYLRSLSEVYVPKNEVKH